MSGKNWDHSYFLVLRMVRPFLAAAGLWSGDANGGGGLVLFEGEVSCLAAHISRCCGFNSGQRRAAMPCAIPLTPWA